MTSFSATDAAFEGFRVARERPRTLLIWAGFYLAVNIVMAFVMIGIGGEKLAALEATANQPNADPTLALENLRALAPLYSILIPLGVLVSSVMAAAVYRVLLRPNDGAPGYLRLGLDEVRLVALTFIYFFLAIGLVFVVVLVAGLTAGLAASVMGGMGGFVGLAVGLFATGLLVYIAVRLSLAPVITFAEQRLAVFDSWRLTHGQFWKLLGTYALALFMVCVVLLLAMLIFVAVAAILAGGDMDTASAIFAPDLTSVGAYFKPMQIAYTAFGALLSALYYTVIGAPAAMAYLALHGQPAPQAAVAKTDS